MRVALCAAFLLLAGGVGTALAQNPAPAAPAASSAPSTTTSPAKSAISKSCSDQANAKGLHGKARKKFRSACKKAGGKTT
jgi:hypothetical protein